MLRFDNPPGHGSSGAISSAQFSDFEAIEPLADEEVEPEEVIDEQADKQGEHDGDPESEGEVEGYHDEEGEIHEENREGGGVRGYTALTAPSSEAPSAPSLPRAMQMKPAGVLLQ